MAVSASRSTSLVVQTVISQQLLGRLLRNLVQTYMIPHIMNPNNFGNPLTFPCSAPIIFGFEENISTVIGWMAMQIFSCHPQDELL